MDYTELARVYLDTLYRVHKTRPQPKIEESMRGEAFALHYIALHDGVAVPSAIGNETGVSAARIATVLNGLENKGWIERRIDPGDRRRTILCLTPAGEQRATQNTSRLLEAVSAMLAYLGEDDAREHIRIIGRLAERQETEEALC